MTSQSSILSDFPEALYPELLRSNDAPTEHQVQGLRMLVNIAEECTSRLGLAATSLELNPRALRAERLRREDFLDKYRGLMASISMRQLPNEILGQIFLEYVKLMFSDEKADPQKSGQEHAGSLIGQDQDRKEEPLLHAPTVLIKVCSRWRAVTLSMTELWSFMRLKLPLNPQRVQTWLNRAGTRPLSLRITSKDRDGQDLSDMYQHASFQLLFLQSNRWVELDVDFGYQSQRFLNHIRPHLPALQRLHMRKQSCQWMISSGTSQMVPHFPQLNKLVFSYHRIDETTSFPTYGNLTHFSGTFYEVSSLSRVFDIVFGNMPGLLVLELSVKNWVNQNPSFNLRPVLHRSLTSFKLKWTATRHGDSSCGTRRYLDSALENVIFPSLTDVSLIAGPGAGDPEAFSSFFARHPTLDTIHISLPNYEVRLDRSPYAPKSLKRLFPNTINVPHGFDTSSRHARREIRLPQGANWGVVMEKFDEQKLSL
ncbi:hypothetical protein VKT23_017047 [Stygiomarasmius scandens]|uniref:F-box domain-containing protein n=1 Tax=Marasmiellus scandens TaxID=2682957 RepID=A0ABR1IVJ5_9AGAR